MDSGSFQMWGGPSGGLHCPGEGMLMAGLQSRSSRNLWDCRFLTPVRQEVLRGGNASRRGFAH